MLFEEGTQAFLLQNMHRIMCTISIFDSLNIAHQLMKHLRLIKEILSNNTVMSIIISQKYQNVKTGNNYTKVSDVVFIVE